jgi:hypothetical protein
VKNFKIQASGQLQNSSFNSKEFRSAKISGHQARQPFTERLPCGRRLFEFEAGGLALEVFLDYGF